MTQRHFLDSVQDDETLDPQFKSLLRHHWMEEVRHAKLDTLMANPIAAQCSAKGRAEAVPSYLEIGAFLDGGLAQQAELDAESFTKATGQSLRVADAMCLSRQRTRRFAGPLSVPA